MIPLAQESQYRLLNLSSHTVFIAIYSEREFPYLWNILPDTLEFIHLVVNTSKYELLNDLRCSGR